MNRELCLVICFFVGIVAFYLLKTSCGCKTVEGNCALSPLYGGHLGGSIGLACSLMGSDQDRCISMSDCAWDATAADNTEAVVAAGAAAVEEPVVGGGVSEKGCCASMG